MNATQLLSAAEALTTQSAPQGPSAAHSTPRAAGGPALFKEAIGLQESWNPPAIPPSKPTPKPRYVPDFPMDEPQPIEPPPVRFSSWGKVLPPEPTSAPKFSPGYRKGYSSIQDIDLEQGGYAPGGATIKEPSYFGGAKNEIMGLGGTALHGIGYPVGAAWQGIGNVTDWTGMTDNAGAMGKGLREHMGEGFRRSVHQTLAPQKSEALTDWFGGRSDGPGTYNPRDPIPGGPAAEQIAETSAGVGAFTTIPGSLPQQLAQFMGLDALSALTADQRSEMEQVLSRMGPEQLKYLETEADTVGGEKMFQKLMTGQYGTKVEQVPTEHPSQLQAFQDKLPMPGANPDAAGPGWDQPQQNPGTEGPDAMPEPAQPAPQPQPQPQQQQMPQLPIQQQPPVPPPMQAPPPGLPPEMRQGMPQPAQPPQLPPEMRQPPQQAPQQAQMPPQQAQMPPQQPAAPMTPQPQQPQPAQPTGAQPPQAPPAPAPNPADAQQAPQPLQRMEPQARQAELDQLNSGQIRDPQRQLDTTHRVVADHMAAGWEEAQQTGQFNSQEEFVGAEQARMANDDWREDEVESGFNNWQAQGAPDASGVPTMQPGTATPPSGGPAPGGPAGAAGGAPGAAGGEAGGEAGGDQNWFMGLIEQFSQYWDGLETWDKKLGLVVGIAAPALALVNAFSGGNAMMSAFGVLAGGLGLGHSFGMFDSLFGGGGGDGSPGPQAATQPGAGAAGAQRPTRTPQAAPSTAPQAGTQPGAQGALPPGASQRLAPQQPQPAQGGTQPGGMPPVMQDIMADGQVQPLELLKLKGAPLEQMSDAQLQQVFQATTQSARGHLEFLATAEPAQIAQKFQVSPAKAMKIKQLYLQSQG